MIKQEEGEKTKENHVKQNNIPKGKHTPLPKKKNKKSVNAITPEPEKKHDLQERQYVFNPQFSTPTSLPVSFFFGYQILHEKKKWGERGHVSLVINNVFRFQRKVFLSGEFIFQILLD